MWAVFSISGCASLQVPVDIHDEDLYYLKGPDGAVKMHFLTEGQTELTKDQWDSISQGMVAMPLSAFEDFNVEIGKLCSQVKCDYITLEKFNQLFARLQALKP